MRIVDNQIKYEILYNLFPGETFVYHGQVYMMCSLQADTVVPFDKDKQRLIIDLSTGSVQAMDKYTYVYPKEYEVREYAKDSNI